MVRLLKGSSLIQMCNNSSNFSVKMLQKKTAKRVDPDEMAPRNSLI